jgi:hypothetical protein
VRISLPLSLISLKNTNSKSNLNSITNLSYILTHLELSYTATLLVQGFLVHHEVYPYHREPLAIEGYLPLTLSHTHSTPDRVRVRVRFVS